VVFCYPRRLFANPLIDSALTPNCLATARNDTPTSSSPKASSRWACYRKDWCSSVNNLTISSEAQKASLRTLRAFEETSIRWETPHHSIKPTATSRQASTFSRGYREVIRLPLQEAVQLINEMITREVKLFTRLSPLVLDAFPNYEKEHSSITALKRWG
jgi:hypothetical protein